MEGTYYYIQLYVLWQKFLSFDIKWLNTPLSQKKFSQITILVLTLIIILGSTKNMFIKNIYEKKNKNKNTVLHNWILIGSNMSWKWSTVYSYQKNLGKYTSIILYTNYTIMMKLMSIIFISQSTPYDIFRKITMV